MTVLATVRVPVIDSLTSNCPGRDYGKQLTEKATSLSASSTVRRGSSTKPVCTLLHGERKSSISDSGNKGMGSDTAAALARVFGSGANVKRRCSKSRVLPRAYFNFAYSDLAHNTLALKCSSSVWEPPAPRTPPDKASGRLKAIGTPHAHSSCLRFQSTSNVYSSMRST